MNRALVLGANGRIGCAVAAELARAGHSLTNAARDRQSLDTLATDLRSTGVEVDVVALDVRDDEAWPRWWTAPTA